MTLFGKGSNNRWIKSLAANFVAIFGKFRRIRGQFRGEFSPNFGGFAANFLANFRQRRKPEKIFGQNLSENFLKGIIFFLIVMHS